MEVAEWSAVGFRKAGLEDEDYGMLVDPILEDQWLFKFNLFYYFKG